VKMAFCFLHNEKWACQRAGSSRGCFTAEVARSDQGRRRAFGRPSEGIPVGRRSHAQSLAALDRRGHQFLVHKLDKELRVLSKIDQEKAPHLV